MNVYRSVPAESSVDVVPECGRLPLIANTGRLVVRRIVRLVVELDGERVLGDVNGDGAPGVDAAERDDLAADADHAGGADAALHGDGLAPRPGRRAGRARALEPQRLLARERVRSDPQQLARVGL